MGNHYNCIYMYTNLINGKKYVGKAKDFNKRCKEHFRDDGQLIDKKINEYGIKNFKVEILIENVQDNDKLNEYEKFFIKRKRSHVSYGTGYNRTWGGDGGDVIGGMTDEQRKEYGRKLSEAKKGKQKSEEHKRKLSESHKGEKNPMYGRPHTEESKRKQSEAHKVKIVCLETKQVFDSIKQAQEWLGKGNIKKHLRGRNKSAGKHPITKQPLHWMYYDEYLKQQNSDNLDSTTNVA